MHVLVIGAGVAGLSCALELAKAGVRGDVIDRGERLGSHCCSWFAGGMLAHYLVGPEVQPVRQARVFKETAPKPPMFEIYPREILSMG